MQAINELLNLKGIQIDKIEQTDTEVFIYCSGIFNEAICKECKEKCKRVTKYYERTIRDLSIFGKRTLLKLENRQYCCQKCFTYFNENFDFVLPKYEMTERYREYIFHSCKGQDINQVADKEGISWDVVNTIFQTWIKKKTTNISSNV
jgi:transposase